jgi:hypothetical protein
MEQDAEAAQFLKEASQSVKKNAYFMRKAMVSCVEDVSIAVQQVLCMIPALLGLMDTFKTINK